MFRFLDLLGHAVAQFKRDPLVFRTACVWFGLGGLCLVGSLGCRRDTSADLAGISTRVEAKAVVTDSVQEAFRDIPKMINFERRVATSEILRQLNSWGERQANAPDWKPSNLVATLPELIARSNWVGGLQKLEFDESHCDFIFQCELMRDVNRWVLAAPYRDPLFSTWLEKQQETLPEKDAIRLEQTLKLFDWTIRNVWMDGNAKDVEKLTLNPLLPLSDDGLGYTQLPWHTMIRARGDFISRARVFSQLAFQQDIPVGWIVFPGITSDQYKLWIMGVPIGDQIYLFEPKLGLPLPGPGQVGVATLADARKDPSVLRRAKVVDQFDYPVSQGDLATAFLALDIDPLAMGRGFALLEKSLTGNMRMRLSADADQWKKEFEQAEPKMEVRLWSLPWFNEDYANNLRSRIKDPTPFAINYMARMALYLDDTAVTRARLAHFAGNHGTDIEQRGAPGLYMELRVDDESLERLPFDRDTQMSLMLKRLPSESPEDFQRRIRQFQILYRQSKLEGSLFLSMLHFDQGNFETAASWADRWMLKIPGTDPWHACCWYQIARNDEQLGKIEEAIDMYKKSPSSQEAGNRIRARLLGK